MSLTDKALYDENHLLLEFYVNIKVPTHELKAIYESSVTRNIAKFLSESEEKSSANAARLEYAAAASTATTAKTDSGYVSTREAGIRSKGLPSDANLYGVGEL